MGRAAAAKVRHLARCGWSAGLSLPVCDRAMLHVDSVCFLPNVRIESHRLRSNTQSATTFRGFGGPQGMQATEVTIEHLAHAMGLGPETIRARIAAFPGAQEGCAPAEVWLDGGQAIAGSRRMRFAEAASLAHQNRILRAGILHDGAPACPPPRRPHRCPHAHDLDLPLCDALLRHGFASLGLIGLATEWTRLRKPLANPGHPAAQISRIACPTDDPGLGKHPQAIALGVATALVRGSHAGRHGETRRNCAG